MSTESKTPRTDEEESTVDDNKVVPSDFARTLELEIQQLEEHNKGLDANRVAAENEIELLEKQIQQLKEAGDKLCSCLDTVFNALTKEEQRQWSSYTCELVPKAITNWQNLTKEIK